MRRISRGRIIPSLVIHMAEPYLTFNCHICRRCRKLIRAGFLCACISLEGAPHLHMESYVPQQVRAVVTINSTSTSTSVSGGYMPIIWSVPPST